MPLKVIRRPYTSCPYLWELEVAGISVGEGECSEAQCEELNGTHLLTYRPCASKGQKLVWETDCESGGSSSECTMPFCFTGPASVEIPGITIDTTTAGATFEVIKPIPTILKFNAGSFKSSLCCSWVGSAVWKVTTADKTPFPYVDSNVVFDRDFWVDNGDGTFTIYITMFFLFHWPFFYSNGGGSGNEVELVALRAYGDGISTNGFAQPEAFYASDLLSACHDVFTLNKRGAARTSLSPCEVSPELDPPPYPFTFGAGPLTATALAGDGGTGPETGDATRGKFRLEYDIPNETFTLHSFERVLYPKWTLSDASPCDGDTKTLLLADKGDAADGCGVAPAEMTITRVCPPDRVGKSALLEDRKPNGATGKRKRQCGCDCLDEVDDRRQCATKCTSTEDEGCERIDPAPDDITCRYPEAINCCATTAGKDVPCAYTVEFECDLFFDIEDVRHKIAAKQVVLRRECYFEDPCLFVAAGPESSTGGSPVMDVDGFPGAQPINASCNDLCLTGCTWSAWTVADAAGCDCGLALCYGTTPLTANVGTIAGLTQTTIQLDQALPYDVLPRCRTYVSFIGGIENRDVFGLNYSMFADLQLSERCLSLSLQYFDNSVSATTFEYATYTASVPDPIVCPDSIVFTKTSGGSVFPNTVEITNP